MGGKIVFELSTQDIKQASVGDVIDEYRQIQAALSRPKVDGWYGFSSSMGNQIESRLIQIRERLSNEYLIGTCPECLRKRWTGVSC